MRLLKINEMNLELFQAGVVRESDRIFHRARSRGVVAGRWAAVA
jgi:hypothetical protein